MLTRPCSRLPPWRNAASLQTAYPRRDPTVMELFLIVRIALVQPAWQVTPRAVGPLSTTELSEKTVPLLGPYFTLAPRTMRPRASLQLAQVARMVLRVNTFPTTSDCFLLCPSSEKLLLSIARVPVIVLWSPS